MNCLRVFLSVLLLCAAPAWAAGTRPAKQKARTQAKQPVREPVAPPPPASDTPTQATPEADGLDFDLLESPVDASAAVTVDPALEAKVARRRTRLRLHQGLGFALVAGLAGHHRGGAAQLRRALPGRGRPGALPGSGTSRSAP